MKHFTLFFFFLSFFVQANTKTDSLLLKLKNAGDKDRFDILIALHTEYLSIDIDTALFYAEKALRLAGKLHDKEKTATALKKIGITNYYQGKSDEALSFFNKALKLYRETGNKLEQANLINNLGLIESDRGNYDKSLELYEESIELYKEIGDSNSVGAGLGNIGSIYLSVSSFDKALQYFRSSYTIAKKGSDQFTIASSLNNIGLVYHYWGKYKEAIDHYQKAAEIIERLNDKKTLSQILLNIGAIFNDWENYEKALEYFNSALKIEEELNDKMNISNTLNNIGIVYDKWGKDKEAMDYYKKALEVAYQTGRKKEIGGLLLNIGVFYSTRNDPQKALDFYRKSLSIRREIDDKQGICKCLMGIGQIYFTLKDYRKALSYYQESEGIAKDLNYRDLMKENYAGFADIYEAMGDFKKSHHSLKLYLAMKDSLFSEEIHKQVRDLQTKYETEKKEKEIKILQNEKEIQELRFQQEELKVKRQRMLIYSFIFGLMVVMGFTVVVISQNRKIKMANRILSQQKEEIEAQRDEIEAQRDLAAQQRDIISSQKQEITDSIHYAFRIQSAVIPSHEYLSKILTDYFILYKPRDIVSGDFYWIGEKNNNIIIIAADCTGHGVPGAFMSMLGVSFLNEIINKKDITDPDKILNTLRDYIIESLKQHGKEGESKDGMDIAAITLDKNRSVMKFAGANNPLYMIKNNELIEFKGNKMPVAIYETMNSFSCREIEINRNDLLYIFSDGYADQFGGPEGKKFKYSRFKKMLLEIKEKSMKEQREIIENTFTSWCGNLDQVDDVLVMGIKV